MHTGGMPLFTSRFVRKIWAMKGPWFVEGGKVVHSLREWSSLPLAERVDHLHHVQGRAAMAFSASWAARFTFASFSLSAISWSLSLLSWVPIVPRIFQPAARARASGFSRNLINAGTATDPICSRAL